MGIGGLDGGGDVGNVVREEAAGGRAALAVSRVVGGVGNFRLQTTSNKLQTCRVAGGAVRKPLRVIQHVGLRFPCLCRVSRDIPARTVQSRPRRQEDYGSNGGGRGRTSLTTQYIVLRTAMSSLCRGRAESRVCIRYFLLVSNRPPTLQHDDILKSENMNSALSYRYL